MTGAQMQMMTQLWGMLERFSQRDQSKERLDCAVRASDLRIIECRSESGEGRTTKKGRRGFFLVDMKWPLFGRSTVVVIVETGIFDYLFF